MTYYELVKNVVNALDERTLGLDSEEHVEFTVLETYLISYLLLSSDVSIRSEGGGDA